MYPGLENFQNRRSLIKQLCDRIHELEARLSYEKPNFVVEDAVAARISVVIVVCFVVRRTVELSPLIRTNHLRDAWTFLVVEHMLGHVTVSSVGSAEARRSAVPAG